MRYTYRNSPLGSRAKSKYFATFYITVCIISAFAVFSFVADFAVRYAQGSNYGIAQRRALAELDAGHLLKRDRDCRSVHDEEDKCAFIKAYCPDEEAGLLSYLTLYYCDLPHAQPLAFLIMVLWLSLLFSTIGIAASDFFCVNLSTIATILGMSESMAGVTFLALGNGSPDVFSTFAAMRTHSGSLAVGELIGAAGFITAVVAGSMALVREFKVGKKAFVRDVGFFIVAASFSMTFLADGALYIWECCIMIGFYLFYVVTVVTWHWYLHRRRKQREKINLARSHYITPASHEIEVQADYDDEDAPAAERLSLRQNRSSGGFDALERAGSPTPDRGSYYDDDSEDDGEGSKFLAAEMRNSMRVTRHRGSRRNTLNPIRPSLVGALEFRSVLSTLQKSRTLQSAPINLRRYSDDPIASSDRHAGSGSENVINSEYGGSVIITSAEGFDEIIQPESSATRARAVSMNDAGGPKNLDPTAFTVALIPEIGVVAATPMFPPHINHPTSRSGLDSSPNQTDDAGPSHSSAGAPSPIISVSPPSSFDASGNVDQKSSKSGQKREDRLVAPRDGLRGAGHASTDYFQPHQSGHRLNISDDSPRYRSIDRPQLIIPGSPRERSLSPIPNFPRYTDSPLPMTAIDQKAPSLILPEPQISPDSLYAQGLDNRQLKRLSWWPYRIWPCPRHVLSTLFPTLTLWNDKSIWDKFLSVISAPSILLLTITLPVVEPESKDDESVEEVEAQPPVSRRTTTPRITASGPYLAADIQPEWIEYRRSTIERHKTKSSSQAQRGSSRSHSAIDVFGEVENFHQNSQTAPVNGQNEELEAQAGDESPTKEWNRWLVVIQIFTAPLFVVLIVWANGSDDQMTLRHLMRMSLYSLLASLVLFLILLLTTVADKPPKYRYLFCFLGFVVSVSWISTIAGEVVGVLKAFGVILGISDAILGLTIFAVGNSLGDLVADITVARLGFPVMALSACFGGPMLNILLGIGVSGLYMTVTDGNRHHAKHPDRPVKYEPYHIRVGSTLIISGIILLITLVGLLIAVPLNKWVMSRRIGWGLIILWSIGTIVNLVVEVTSTLGQSEIVSRGPAHPHQTCV